MARGYQRVSAALEGEIWKRLQSGYAARSGHLARGETQEGTFAVDLSSRTVLVAQSTSSTGCGGVGR